MKKHLLTGLVTLLPLVLTILVIQFLFDLTTEPFVSVFSFILSYLPFTLSPPISHFLSRIFSLALLFLLILLLGAIARHFFLKNLLRWTNRILARIPFVNTIYKVTREVMKALFSPDGKQAFKEPVMYTFPSKPHYAIGFLAGQAPPECSEKTGKKLVSIFGPTAPHPISGFLFMIPADQVHPIDMSKEDAIKFLVSCGVITPDTDRHDHL